MFRRRGKGESANGAVESDAPSEAQVDGGPSRQFQVLLDAKKLPPLELQAHEQIRQQRVAGRIALPAPLFEHARLHRFMREVFETVAYGKTSEPAAAARLIEEGNALLQRIK